MIIHCHQFLENLSGDILCIYQIALILCHIQSVFLPFIIYLFIYLFLGPQVWHMEVPRLGLESELQLLTYTISHDNARSLTH